VVVVSPRQMMVIGKTFGKTTLVYWSQEEVANTVEVIVGINLDLVREDLGDRPRRDGRGHRGR